MTERRCVRDIHAYNGRIAPIIGRNRLNPPARLAALFILLAGTPVIALGWLGWRLLHQEDLLERQRDRERLESAAALITLQLNRSLARWEQLLQDPQSSTLPEGSALLRFDARGVVNSVGRALPYFPAVHPPAPLDLSRFAAAETYEFQTEDFDKAAATYRALAANSTLSVRAAALMRLARCLRKQNRLRQAIAVYAELASMGHTTVGGDPAELLARREQVGLLKATGDDFGAAREAQLLSQALRRGQFVIDRPTFEFYNNSSPAPHSLAAELSDAVDMAEAVIALWPRWLEQPSGRASLMSGTHAYASVWGRNNGESVALVAPVDRLAEPLRTVANNGSVRFAVRDASGNTVWGDLRNGGDVVARRLHESGLPWTVSVASINGRAEATATSRRWLLGAGFLMMVAVIAAASFFVFRAVNRELSVARLQSDFVAAVSHEFRTPLTAMCHLTEMLEQGTATNARLPQYFSALRKESLRLQALVEMLLDFGRIEAGRAYEFAETDVHALVHGIVEDIREQSIAAADRVRLAGSQRVEGVTVRVDRGALSVALRNLIDNALKYSPEQSAVTVIVDARGDLARICVEDEGAGIPKEEQRTVFQKFTRGSAARAMNVRGTGIGLTMAREIARAHGGRLELDSEPGRGSRFTISLPV